MFYFTWSSDDFLETRKCDMKEHHTKALRLRTEQQEKNTPTLHKSFHYLNISSQWRNQDPATCSPASVFSPTSVVPHLYCTINKMSSFRGKKKNHFTNASLN